VTARCDLTGPATALGCSWLASAPDGAVVVRRRITLYTVAEVGDGHIGATPEGKRHREYFDTRMVADEDAPLVAVGARFWLVVESFRGRPGMGGTALAFRRPGVDSAQQAFDARRGGAP